jgi:hypothetical protein
LRRRDPAIPIGRNLSPYGEPARPISSPEIKPSLHYQCAKIASIGKPATSRTRWQNIDRQLPERGGCQMTTTLDGIGPKVTNVIDSNN